MKNLKEKDVRFPLIAKHINGNIVCFTHEGKGVVLSSEIYKIGDFAENWVPYTNKEYWTIIAQPNEYPKKMYVSDKSEEDAILKKKKTLILGYSEKNKRYINEDAVEWTHAVDIQEEENSEDKLRQDVKELEQDIKKGFENLKELELLFKNKLIEIENILKQ
jgi:hypothetical protein